MRDPAAQATSLPPDHPSRRQGEEENSLQGEEGERGEGGEGGEREGRKGREGEVREGVVNCRV